MLEWIFAICGWSLALVGVLIIWRLGWRDTGKGTRRCPKCWYDMSATAGLKCSECGHEASAERQLHRSNRRWRYVVLGAVLMLASYPIFKWPLYLKDGPIGFVPRVVTFAFLPEISDQIRKRLPSTAPSGVQLVQKLSKNSPLWVWERAILALTFERMLRDNTQSAYARFDILRESPMLGDQVWIALPAIAKCVETDSVFEQSWSQIAGLPFSPAFKHLAPSFARSVARNPERIGRHRNTLHLLRSWGATDEEMHEVLVAALDCNLGDVNVLATDYLWRNSLARPEDIPVLLAKLTRPDGSDAHYATNCLADLGPETERLLEQMRSELRTKVPSRVLNACVLLSSMRAAAKPALADFDIPSWTLMDESQRDVAAFAAASIRGSAGVVARPYSLASRAFGPRGVHDYFEVPALIYHSPLRADEKVRQLLEIVEIGKLLLGRQQTPFVLEFALVFLGKLGSDAQSAVPRLITLCSSGRREEIRLGAADAILKIGIHSREDAAEILKILAIAGPAQPGVGPMPNPALEWKLKQLKEMATERARK
jgi:hypothetical protein